MKSDIISPLRKAAGLILILSVGVLVLAIVSFVWAGPRGLDWWAVGGIIFGTALFLAALWVFSLAKRLEQVSAGNGTSAVAPELTAVPPPSSVAASKESGAEALLFLSLLQEKGRFVDFLMEDISAYSNEQVGAASRVVHQGCREVVNDAFSPQPVASAPENSTITLEAGYNAEEFRLVGKVDGKTPQSGKVVHKGWRASQVKLPRRHHNGKDLSHSVIVPAEVSV